MEVTVQDVLDFLYGIQRKTKQAQGRAESRSGVTREELDALKKKLACIDYLIVKTWEDV